MYEAFFGLRKRPYAAAPDASLLVGTPAVTAAAARLDRCVRQGRGVGVVTAAAGMGKTQLCHWLAREWSRDFKAVVLPNAGFPTRRGLLQSILAELDEPYQRLAEAELRLQLTGVARALKAQGGGVVLLFDESHRHSERILEEIRLISNLVDDGEPLIRIVLAGQLELEERLAEPALAGLNERVGELVTLPRFTADESRQYLRDRAMFAGGDVTGLFEPAAIGLVVQACGGVPRCLNQLADHALLLGYVAERRPVDAGLVREALDDLKRLPLHWYDPLPTGGRIEHGQTCETSNPFPETTFDETIEIGGLSEGSASDAIVAAIDHGELSEDAGSAESSIPADSRAAFATRPTSVEELPKAQLPRAEIETIRDRFARLDADDARRRWAELVELAGAGREPSAACISVVTAPRRQPGFPANPLEILDRIEPLIAEALYEAAAGPDPLKAEVRDAGTGSQLTAATSPAVATVASPAPPRAPSVQASHVGVRQSTLFSELRRRGAGHTRSDR